MATLVSFHAHPDDESIACGGVLRQAYEEGHRVVLVLATRGEQGEIEEGFLADGESLAERRVAETQAAAEILGAARLEFLGYVDSGMMGTAANDAPGAFWSAPVDDAARKLAAILREEQADALTCYDNNGGYGHLVIIEVQKVGMRAAGWPARPGSTRARRNATICARLPRAGRAGCRRGIEIPDVGEEEEVGEPSGRSPPPWTLAYLEHKRQAMRAHASQISEHCLRGVAGRGVPLRVRYRRVHP